MSPKKPLFKYLFVSSFLQEPDPHPAMCRIRRQQPAEKHGTRPHFLLTPESKMLRCMLARQGPLFLPFHVLGSGESHD
jgi:hypothetical protein